VYRLLANGPSFSITTHGSQDFKSTNPELQIYETVTKRYEQERGPCRSSAGWQSAPTAAAAMVPAQVWSDGICGGQNGIDAGFVPSI
jgi:hypothetical protein